LLPRGAVVASHEGVASRIPLWAKIEIRLQPAKGSSPPGAVLRSPNLLV